MATSDTNIQISVYEAVIDIMENAAIWTTPFTVYDESDLASLESQPEWPFVFILPEKIPDEFRFLPIIVVQVVVENGEWQLGTISKLASTAIHVIARSKGQVSQLRDVLAEYLDIITVNDYSTGSAVALTQSSFVDEWETIVPEIGNTLMRQATLSHWITLENTLVVM